MDNMIDELRRLRDNDPDVAYMPNVFGEIESVYRETLEAMGLSQKSEPEVMNSAEVLISFDSTPSSAQDYKEELCLWPSAHKTEEITAVSRTLSLSRQSNL
jgi:hypothetical protein